MMIKTWVDHI